jgi:hypothetical protein
LPLTTSKILYYLVIKKCIQGCQFSSKISHN